MSAQDNCPKCGSPFRALLPGVGIQFGCATIVLPVGGRAEGLPCVMRQRDQLAAELQTLRTANAALVEGAKQLQEVADIMANAYEEILCDNHDAKILENYRKVRSEKG